MNISSSRRPRQPSRQPWSLERLVFERAVALGHSLARSTQGAYSSALNSYLEFCKLHNRSIEPTDETISFYVVFMSHHIQPRSVENYLSGIAIELEPHFPHTRQITNSPLVRRTLRGCLRMRSAPVRRKRALTPDDLQTVVSALSSPDDTDTNLDNLLFLAQLLTGFHALLRLGELVWPDNPSLRSYRSVTMRHTVTMVDDRYGFLLPTHKADPFATGSQVLVTSPHLGPNPLRYFKSYIYLRDSHFPLRPELWLRGNGSVPTRAWFIRRLREFFPSDIAGHSMRSGGATYLAAAGMPPHLIQACGRWSSDAWQAYVRQHPVLLHAMCFTARTPT